jgi:hypothetical protein
VAFSTDQRRLTPAGIATIYGTLATGTAVVVVIDDHDRDTDDLITPIDDDEVRGLVMPPELAPRRHWWQRHTHAPSR